MTDNIKSTIIDRLAERAGSMTELRRLMGDVPWSTASRWNQTIREKGEEALPRSAKLAIAAAEKALRKRNRADA